MKSEGGRDICSLQAFCFSRPLPLQVFFFLGQVPFTIFLFFWERRTIFSRTQQSFRETAIFSKTKKSFRKQSSLFENVTKLSRTLKSFLEHNEIF